MELSVHLVKFRPNELEAVGQFISFRKSKPAFFVGNVNNIFPSIQQIQSKRKCVYVLNLLKTRDTESTHSNNKKSILLLYFIQEDFAMNSALFFMLP